jgi:ribosomal protein L16/L10AE
MFEIGGMSEEAAKDALRRVAMKLPVRCRLVARKHGV